jgi:hypothetical protein
MYLNKLKNIFLLIIAFAFMFNSFGFIIYFIFEIENTKKNAFGTDLGTVVNKTIEVISVTIAQLENGIEVERINDREIRYRGYMYDLVKVERHLDIVTFYCINDEKENMLEKEFSENLRKNINHKSVTNTQIQFNQLIQIADEDEMIAFNSPVHKTSYPIVPSNIYSFQTIKIITPPPKSNLS